ncbi:sulfatase-like hydrolase/transferase [Marinilactibacillus sp. XAAS-LB27]|uniref:sulfatase-like hydrolase/transferase n=1 Tax=Marinilactibacillus sp. XAAS-LB27 TaxID=3114538 RepID=UPI002E174298|nr:sulfatase-like hydrolase/transferase [Marinilactibacillus sp. XAAS-LB27]
MTTQKKPNIVMVVADQWRADSLGYTGNNAIKTPNIDALASEGVGFTNAYCQNPVCVPSRNSFLTGWYPHTKGFRTMHYLMDDSEPNILKTLKNNDYHVYWGGRNDTIKADGDRTKYADTINDQFYESMAKLFKGKKDNTKSTDTEVKPDYTHYHGVKESVHHVDQDQIQNAIEFLENDTFNEDPFCVYLALSLPHPPYEIDQEWFDKVDPDLVPDAVRLSEEEWKDKPSILRGIRKHMELYDWSDEDLKKIKQVYYAMGMKLDHHIGKLVQTLKEKDLYDDTIFIFFSDHGDYTGDFEIAEKNQNTFEDILTNVPLVIKPSKNMEVVPRNTDALVELIDIQATIMDLVGIQPEHTQFGQSLKSVLEGSNEHRDVVFAEGGRLESEGAYAMDAGHDPSNPYWARTTEQEKMPQHTKAIMIRNQDYKYVYRLYEQDEFYDLKQDPNERKNIIESEKFETVIKDLQGRMLNYFVETSDVVPHVRDSRF